MTSTDIATLGRYGQPLRSAGSRRRRRRRAAPALLAGVLAVTLAGVGWLGVSARRQTAASAPAVAAARAAVPARPPAATSRGSGGGALLATVDGLPLLLPARDPHTVAFSEGHAAAALALQPAGRLQHNLNDAYAAGPDRPGPAYSVLAAQLGSRPATSGVEVVTAAGQAVVSPVDGRVTQVVEYPLPGGVRDWRVELRPAGRPDLAVVVSNVRDPDVRAGQRVAAGRTPLGQPRLLPFTRPVDRLVGQRLPHVHLEVSPALARPPLDPNEPAAEAVTP